MPSDPKNKLTKAPVFWLLALLLVLAPYQIGLFFQREWLYNQIFIALLLVLALTTRRKNLGLFGSPLDFAGLGLLLAYIAGALSAVNARTAVGEALKLASFLAVYWIFAYGGWSRRDFRALIQLLFWGGFGVAGVGLLAALGVSDFNGAYVDGRIYSTFQYANTLAAFLGIVIFFGVYFWSETKSWLRVLYPAALYPVVVCLISTGSRGGIGVFILTTPLLLWVLPGAKRRGQAKRLLYSFVFGAAGAVLLLKYLAEQNTAGAWVVLIGGLLAAAALPELVGRLAKAQKKYVLTGAVAVLVVLSLVYGLKASGDNPLTRLRSASLKVHEFQERLTYYQDGLALAAKRPVLGYGGGGWALYPRYQEYPYKVSDPHSQPVKVAVESGFLGLTFYIAWWVFLSLAALRKIRQGDTLTAVVFAALLILALHSLIDFDLSFGAMGLLQWSAAGIIISGEHPFDCRRRDWAKYPVFAAALIIAAFLAFSGVSFLQAVEQEGWSKFYLRQGQITKALDSLEEARKWDPFSAGFPSTEAELYSTVPEVKDFGKARKALEAALRLDGTDPNIKDLGGRTLAAQGELKQAAALAEEALSFRSLDPKAYLSQARFYEALAAQALEQGKRDEAREFLLQGAQQASRFEQRMARIPRRASELWVGEKPKTPPELVQESEKLAQAASRV